MTNNDTRHAASCCGACDCQRCACPCRTEGCTCAERSCDCGCRTDAR